MKIISLRIIIPAVCLILAAFVQCHNPAHKTFTAGMLEGDWIPVDTLRFSRLDNNLFTALSFYNNKGGIPDTSYSVKDDTIFVKTALVQTRNAHGRKEHWRFWRRIYDVRNDTLFLYKHSTDTMMALARAKVISPTLNLRRISFLIVSVESSRLPKFGKLEICGDTVFATPGIAGNEKVFYSTGNTLLAYMQDKIRRIKWSRTDTAYAQNPATTDRIALIIETNRWTKTFCCYQNFRDPVFNQMMRQLDQLGGILNMKELPHSHRFAVSSALDANH